MLGRSHMRLVLVLSAVLTAACFDPLFDESEPAAGEKSVCCSESSSKVDVHIAAAGELANSRVFPGCSCYAGRQCSPFYKASGGGTCYPLFSGSDAGTVSFDAGSPPNNDAGTTSPRDAGTSGADAGALVDAGVPTDWAACCISGQLTTCLCPLVGDCAASKFRLCGGTTCSSNGVCSAQ